MKALAEVMSELKMGVMTKSFLSLLIIGVLVGCRPKATPYDSLKVDPQNLIDDLYVEIEVGFWLSENHEDFTGKLTDDDLDVVRELQLRSEVLVEGVGMPHISGKSFKALNKLKNLNRLEIYSDITGSGVKEIGKLQQLAELTLKTSSPITDESFKELAKLKRLSILVLDLLVLDLEDISKITDAGLQELASLEILERLEASLFHRKGPRSQVQVTRGVRERLKKALPKCSIIINGDFR